MMATVSIDGLLRVAEDCYTWFLDLGTIFRFGFVGRLVDPPEFDQEPGECVGTLVSAHRPKILRVEDLLADMRLKRDKNRTVRNCSE